MTGTTGQKRQHYPLVESAQCTRTEINRLISLDCF